jgi:hypothetical protein
MLRKRFRAPEGNGVPIVMCSNSEHVVTTCTLSRTLLFVFDLHLGSQVIPDTSGRSLRAPRAVRRQEIARRYANNHRGLRGFGGETQEELVC